MGVMGNLQHISSPCLPHAARHQETDLQAAGAAGVGAASRVQPVLDKVTSLRLQPSVIHLLQPTVLLNRQLSPSHMDGEADLYCLCEIKKKKKKMLPPPSLNAPPVPTSLVQHK